MIDMTRSAAVSPCGALRFALTRRLVVTDARNICFIGLHPSTADAEQDDPTVRRLIHFTRAWGYDGFWLGNLYPFRSPHPKAVRERYIGWDERQKWHIRDELGDNLDYVVRIAKRALLVVCMWGADPIDFDWMEHCVESIQAGLEPWPALHCFGTCKNGQPIHPMARGKRRVPDDAKPLLWRGAA